MNFFGQIRQIINPSSSQSFPFQFVLDNPPYTQKKNSYKQCQTMPSHSATAKQIADKILQYNSETWKFGNFVSQQDPNHILNSHILPNPNAYNALLNSTFNYSQQQKSYNPQISHYNNPQSYLSPSTNQEYSAYYNQQLQSSQLNYFQNTKQIIDDVKSYLTNNPECILNTFISISLQQIFPKLPQQFLNIKVNVTLLGLAALIGAEHLVIVFLQLGADPSLINTNNKDSAYNLIHFQLALHKLIRLSTQGQLQKKQYGSQNQFMYQSGQQPLGPVYSTNANKSNIANIVPVYYFIADLRIEFILTLLGSNGNGIDLSRIVQTDELVNLSLLSNQPTTPIRKKSNLLCQLSSEDSLLNNKLISNTQSNSANSTYNLLNFILTYNGQNGKLHLFSDINAKTIPLGYTPINYLLSNRTLVNFDQKKYLVELMIKNNADPTIMPDLLQNSKAKNIFIDICSLIQFYYQGPNFQQINSILSTNENYKQKCQISSTQPSIPELTQKLKEYQTEINKLKSNVALKSNIITKLTGNQSQMAQPPMQQPQPQYNSVFHSDNQVGGKKISLRTFHFPKQKSYDEKAFKATRPKIAAENAYEFLKTHYNIKNNKINFTIEDRKNKKKYKYSAVTKKGISQIKSLD